VCICFVRVRACLLVTGIREQANRLRSLPIDDVAQDAGRLLFLLDDCLHSRLSPAFSELLVSQPPVTESKLQRAGAASVYISYAKGDEHLALEIAAGLRREGIAIVSRESVEAQHKISEHKATAMGPTTLSESATRLDIGGLSVHTHGSLESMKVYGPSVRGMCGAILQADVVLVIASQHYFESYKCRLEANYLANPKVRACVLAHGAAIAHACAERSIAAVSLCAGLH